MTEYVGFGDDIKSNSRYCFKLGLEIFSWCSKKQETLAQSTAEAEFIVAIEAINQVSWLKTLLHM